MKWTFFEKFLTIKLGFKYSRHCTQLNDFLVIFEVCLNRPYILCCNKTKTNQTKNYVCTCILLIDEWVHVVIENRQLNRCWKCNLNFFVFICFYETTDLYSGRITVLPVLMCIL